MNVSVEVYKPWPHACSDKCSRGAQTSVSRLFFASAAMSGLRTRLCNGRTCRWRTLGHMSSTLTRSSESSRIPSSISDSSRCSETLNTRNLTLVANSGVCPKVRRKNRAESPPKRATDSYRIKLAETGLQCQVSTCDEFRIQRNKRNLKGL